MRLLIVLVIGVAVVGAGLAVARPWDHNATGTTTVIEAHATVVERSDDDVPAPTAVPATPEAKVAAATNPAPPPVLASPGCGMDVEPGDFVNSLPTSYGDRSYRLHLPASYVATNLTPLVLNFHGSAQTALAQEIYSQLVPVSEKEGFILVTPEGSGAPQGWDIPGVYNEDGFDDIDFTIELLDDVEQNLCVDQDRVYATGLSNGAEMASLLGCRHPELFAAVAPVAGVIYDNCEAPGVPIIAFHGTFDYNIPFDSIPATMDQWAEHNGCDSGEDIEQYTESVSTIGYGDCGGRDVVLFVVNGGGHTWPGAEDDAGGAGPTTHEINADELIWAFFLAHPRTPEAAAATSTVPADDAPPDASDAAPGDDPSPDTSETTAPDAGAQPTEEAVDSSSTPVGETGGDAAPSP